MRYAVLVVLPACSFGARAKPPGDAVDVDAREIDAAASDAAMLDARILDARMVDARRMIDAPPPFCDAGDATLVACYEFEGTTADGGPHHLDAAMTNVTFVAGETGMAAVASAQTQMNAAQNAVMDPANLTVEAWIKAPLPGAGLRAGILDNEGAWGLFLEPQGGLQCITGTIVAANVQANTWTHVACTADGANRKIYVNGTLIDTAAAGALGTGTQGWALGANSPSGSQLAGNLDQVRVFSVARTATQIAADMNQR